MATLSADTLNEMTQSVIGAAIKVHRVLGPGLLESAYLACLAFELRREGLKVRTQFPVPVAYEDVTLDCGFRADVIVEDAVILEIKAVEQLAAIHLAQMMTYLRLTGHSVGLIINFNTKVLTQGVRRVVNKFPDATRKEVG
jgi:GxxExxY protein